MNVLIVPGTTLIAREICNSLATAKEVHLFGAGYDKSAAGDFPYCEFDFVGALDTDNFIADIQDIVERRDIDCILLAHDSWIFELRDLELIGKAKIIKNPSSIIEVTSFKSSTYDFLQDVVPTPRLFKSLGEIEKFPIFLKPDRGQGAVGASKLNDYAELEPFAGTDGCFDKKWVISEFLPGKEFTVDCFSDENAELIYSSPRIRTLVQNGLAVETRLVEHTELSNWAQLISRKLKIIGPWFFQAKEDDFGLIKLLEVGLRVAGGSGIQRLKGINLSLISILQSEGTLINVINQHVFPRMGISDFDLNFKYSEIYIDYDDTLIVNSELNSHLLHFLRASKAKGIKLILITRHAGNLDESLTGFSLKFLFSKIIHISNGDNKSAHIDSKGDFLFIDDSFRERLDVWTRFRNKVLVLDESFAVR